ncbi:hypothetical protein KUTeg_005193 [Tegillarca granosa]|uniref:Failed axon connections protein n=1 Tax=Tegillarca granosa TaxID=220873 RepID=A0ABQ9FJ20_TEGGR|nr:hypothetical protein KUTeg_005193 [Tegillarca granosa]
MNAPPGVVILYQVGRGPNAPSISPFPLKLETFLRMAKIPYMNDHTAKFSTKGKTPWMEYNGVDVADSQFCIEYLKKELGADLNKHLTAEEYGASRALQKMAEENLYWTMCDEMFLTDDTTVIRNIIPYRGVKLWATLWFLRRIIRKETWGHGIGRHSKDEIWSIAVGDLRAISGYLGNKARKFSYAIVNAMQNTEMAMLKRKAYNNNYELNDNSDKKFLTGDEPCEADCGLFGMLAMIVWHMPTSRHEKLVKEELTNLVTYCERMRDKYWPDWNKCILSSSEYVNDHGKIYRPDGVVNGTS